MITENIEWWSRYCNFLLKSYLIFIIQCGRWLTCLNVFFENIRANIDLYGYEWCWKVTLEPVKWVIVNFSFRKSPVANSVWTWWLLLLSLDVTLYSAQPTEHDHESSCLFLFYPPIHSAYLKLTKKTYNCKLLDWDTEPYWENKCNLYWNLSRLKFLVKLKKNYFARK